jgi:NAD(P)-dependent dehydrogenase (short-subunit alcohol dehydrogenase family)
VARGFIHSGCTKIAITDVNAATLSQTKAVLETLNPSAQILAIDGNIADEAFVDSLLQSVVSAFDRLDYAVNCAGVLGPSLRSDETAVAEFDRINGVNYRGCWLSSRAELRVMKAQTPLVDHPGQRGAVVSIASQLGVVGRPQASMWFRHFLCLISTRSFDILLPLRLAPSN